MPNQSSFDYSLVGSVVSYCTLHKRVKIKTPKRFSLLTTNNHVTDKKNRVYEYTAICKHCGKEFEATKPSIKFCSIECKTEKWKHKCLICDTVFVPKNFTNIKTCSRKCGQVLRFRNIKEAAHYG